MGSRRGPFRHSAVFRKRLSAKGAMSGGTVPVAINSAIPVPEAGIALKPQVPHPDERKNRSTGVTPMSGE